MWGSDDEDNGSGVVVSNKIQDVEFPTERQNEDKHLFCILWGWHSVSNNSSESVIEHTEDINLSKLFPSLVDAPLSKNNQPLSQQ